MPADVRIRKHKIAVQASDERMAVRCRQIIAELATRELATLYERIFNQQEENSTSYLNIGKLQIDLGTMTEKEMEMNFINALEAQIRNVLEELLAQSPVPDDTPAHSAKHQDPDVERTTPVTYKSESQQNIEILQHYLEQGHYPWWITPEKSTSAEALYRRLSDQGREELLLFMIRKFKNWTEARRNAAIKRLLASVNGVSEVEAVKTIEQLSGLFSDSTLERNVDTVIANYAYFAEVFGIKPRIIHERLLYTILSAETQGEILKYFVESLFKDHKVVNQQALESLVNHRNSLLSGLAFSTRTNDADETPKAHTSKQDGSKNTNQPEIYINNAGLIILHPFLAPFFNLLGLTNEHHAFQRSEDKPFAAVLLHYLQTGETAYEEREMSLNKVLCGMDTSDAIDHDICIPAPALQASRSLLEELIGHWTALKGSSVESVQHSFFTRPGKLSFNGNAWLLQVERTAMDVLVDRLPWGLSVIKLPWNKQLIYTEW